MNKNSAATQVCIVGGGPAGMVLGLELAKSGIDVTVLEKNADFDREFRGEILQPRFFRAVEQVGMCQLVQSFPQERFSLIKFFFKGIPIGFLPVALADFRYPYITWMTQPNLLKGLYDSAKSLPSFHLAFGATVKDVLKNSSGVTGVVYEKNGELVELSANITVGADGRFSALRRLGDFDYEYKIHHHDVMWFEIDRPAGRKPAAQFYFSTDQLCLILPKYPDKIQCGLILSRGKVRKYLKEDHAYVAKKLKQIHPIFREIGDQIAGSKSFTVLNAKIELMNEWSRDGLLLIGDAAHTCSPAGAIGVTIATETAIAAAAVISEAIKKQDYSKRELAKVREIRIGEVKRVHLAQRIVHRLLLNPVTHAIAPFVIGLGSILFIAPIVARTLISRSTPIIQKNKLDTSSNDHEA
jgi:2-polyprenyl-6-methoxyphenol hydroxylase-like FAD-dependent oxidoreductase